MGADPIACAALAGGFDGKAFFVRKETKAHGLARRIEGPLLERRRPLRGRRGRRHARAARRSRRSRRCARPGRTICGVISVLDRLMGGGEAIEAAARRPYVALRTIDDVYPDRPAT